MSEKWKSPDKYILIDWVKKVLLVSNKLNQWEKDFINDMYVKLHNGTKLSQVQVEKLESIYAEKT